MRASSARRFAYIISLFGWKGGRKMKRKHENQSKSSETGNFSETERNSLNLLLQIRFLLLVLFFVFKSRGGVRAFGTLVPAVPGAAAEIQLLRHAIQSVLIGILVSLGQGC